VPKSAHVVTDFVPIVKCRDHLPIVADILINPVQTKLTRSRRAPTYSRESIMANAQTVRSQLAALPLMPATLEPTSHEYVISEQIRGILEGTWPKRYSTSTPEEHLSEQTYTLVIQARTALRASTRAGMRLRTLLLSRAFNAIHQAHNDAFAAINPTQPTPIKMKLLRDKAVKLKRYERRRSPQHCVLLQSRPRHVCDATGDTLTKTNGTRPDAPDTQGH
jgi:hypothetical protein